ncbi:MAG TPA: T9SS type A sorting domain-containing protein, partial [Bacteroidales bacterium]|nr:T9SS type A sorting domain-containing protein [Bacteroidales bacterium]
FLFDLLVWSDNNGRPGEVIYRLDNQKVKWENGLYRFYPYMLSEPLTMAGVFYVGWEKHDPDNMNIGMDANNNKQDKIFYKTELDWFNASVPGALLIRPIVGSNLVLSTNELFPVNDNSSMKVFPNPTSQYFSISNQEIDNDPNAKLKIYNVYGLEMLNKTGVDSKVNISGFPAGIYIVRVVSKNKHYTAKLLIK